MPTHVRRIRGFVHEDWVAQVDFTTLERVNQSFVTDNLLDREDDIIWRPRSSGWNEVAARRI